MKKKGNLIKCLKKYYPESECALKHKNPFQLLVATILSAQCADERVNKVTPNLFRKYPGPKNFAKANVKNIEALIRSTGFYKNKAKSIKESSKIIVKKFRGDVPKTMEELLSLKGVARKTANVVLGSGYGIAAGIVVDTHVKRLSFRMGLTENLNPVKIEKDLMKIIAKKDWIWLSHALINHGRKICRARKTDCANCPLEKLCPKNGI